MNCPPYGGLNCCSSLVPDQNQSERNSLFGVIPGFAHFRRESEGQNRLENPQTNGLQDPDYFPIIFEWKTIA